MAEGMRAGLVLMGLENGAALADFPGAAVETAYRYLAGARELAGRNGPVREIALSMALSDVAGVW